MPPPALTGHLSHAGGFTSGGTRSRREPRPAIDPATGLRVAVHAFGCAHLGLFVGIVAVAAGVKKAVGHVDGHLSLPEAAALVGGLAVFLASDVRVPAAPAHPTRCCTAPVAALVMVAVIPVAMVAGALGLGAAVVVLSVMLFFEDRARGLRWGDRSAWTGPHNRDAPPP